jgi:2,4-dienoyl-CoA reductase-like NADH-dependent reductase (Old Yellow Enzyme family)
MTSLFNPLTINTVTLKNRIGMSPMSMYSSIDGVPTDFDQHHYVSRAKGGTGLIFTGTVAVSPEGRITPGDPGLWTDEHIAPLAHIAKGIKQFGAVPAIQIGHAGRKASTTIPWQGGQPKSDGRSLTTQEGAWQTVAPSLGEYGADKLHQPEALSKRQIEELIEAFKLAAVRADKAGFEVLEIHAAHGYLLHEFYSPLTNKREDEYGYQNNFGLTFPLAVVKAVRAVWPANKILAVRINMDDFHTQSMQQSDGIRLAKTLVNHGVDVLDVMSFGGIAPDSSVPWDKPFIIEQAKALKAALPETQVMISAQSTPDEGTDPHRLNQLIEEGIDIVLMGRELLSDPYWPARAARKMGDDSTQLPAAYEHWLTGKADNTKGHPHV